MKEKFSLKPKEKSLPRSMEEINKEYSELISKVGQAQYQAYAYTRETERLNAKLIEINLESRERHILDNQPKQVNKEAGKEAADGQA